MNSRRPGTATANPYPGSVMPGSRRRLPLLLVAPLLAVAIATATVAAPARDAAAATAPVGVTEPVAWIVVDAGTGRVLAAKDAHTPYPPASMAKIMTALVAVERLPADTQIEISELAASQPPSKLGALAGEHYRLDDALAAILMVSSNDIAYAVAEATGDDLAGFADLLNATAKRYGMNDSSLSDPAGFDDATSFRGGPRMSAFDVAISVRNARSVPDLARWAGTRNYEFDGPAARFALLNHNKALPEGSRAIDGVNGFKTGGTNLAGNTLAATATRGNRSVIVVVMNTPDVYAWTQYLLDVGFETAAGADGTGEQLPPVAVSVRAQRERDREEFLALVTGQAAVGATTTVADLGVEPFVTTSTIASGDTDAAAAGSGDQAVAAATDSTGDSATSTTTAAAASGGGGGGLPLVPIAIVVLLLGAFVARREQIKARKRARRFAQRERATMMRRGSLPVVDGRYRTGTRVGPPVQSHVRVRRTDGPADAPPDEGWEEWPGWDDGPPTTPRR